MDRATGLIEQILANPSDLGGVANELLSEYYRGSDVSSLRKLLHSGDDKIVDCGTWIAGELAEVGKPLLPELKRLLGHPSKGVRFWAIECVQEWAGPTNGYELASAVGLVDDAEQGVRWKAMSFVSMISREQLQAALAQLEADNPESPFADELRWILGPNGSDSTQIAAGLRGSDPRHRKFAAAAAFRMAKSDSRPLRDATASDDPEIAQFTGDMLKRISLAGGI
jgi:hypothetical protein